MFLKQAYDEDNNFHDKGIIFITASFFMNLSLVIAIFSITVSLLIIINHITHSDL